MMFGGFAAGSPDPSRIPAGAADPPPAGAGPIPLGARMLGTDPLLWCVDAPSLVIAHQRTTVGIFGTSTATADELHGLLSGLPDSALVRWAGAYTLVHTTPTATTILTDPAGAQPIYYTRWDNGFVWASSARALAGLSSASSGSSSSGASAASSAPVDAEWLSARLAEPTPAERSGAGSSVGSVPTAFSGVRRAPPGARITFGASRFPRIESCWQPGATDFETGASRLRTALQEGISARTSGLALVTADCSGGLDSTVVCLLCGPSRVVAVNSQPADALSGGDLGFVAAVDEAYPELKRARIPLRDPELPYSGLDRLAATDEPPRSVVVAGRLATVWAHLRELDSELHLGGDGADALLGVPLGYLADLARTGRRPWRAWRDAREWAYLTSRTPLSVVRSAWQEGRTPTQAVLADVRSTAQSAASDVQLAAASGVHYANPYLDNRVVDAVAGVPVWLHGSPRSYKPLLTTAFADLLPAPVARRRTKGSFLADHFHGIRANLPALTTLVDGELAGLGLVSPPEIRAVLERAAAGVGVDLTRVERVIGTEAWLRAVRREPFVRWVLPT